MPRASGFTLIEVAVAMAILGIGVVTVIELFSGGLRMAGASGVRARAVVHARTILDRATTVPEPQPLTAQGELPDGMRWELAVREAPEYTDGAKREFDVQSDLTMYEVEVSVLWQQSADRQGVYTVRTLRVGPRPPS
jgi:prepilin-type N-terminal cleavage/methylation domain-containing protein